jgi:ABC-type lipoprotein export system ATPase subunit
MMLAALSVRKRYAFDLLSDCSLTVEEGEALTIRGVSGGGKSTLLRILARLEAADGGVVVHGNDRFDASTLDDSPPYPFLTLVFQQLFLWPNLTMAENLSLVLYGTRHVQFTSKEEDLLCRMGVDGLMLHRPHECSLGQQQRVAVARALLSNARFLLLDEPSSALDRANRMILAEELAAAKSAGRGIVIVTHDERDFDQIADHRLNLENGRLVEL